MNRGSELAPEGQLTHCKRRAITALEQAEIDFMHVIYLQSLRSPEKGNGGPAMPWFLRGSKL